MQKKEKQPNPSFKGFNLEDLVVNLADSHGAWMIV